MKKQELENLRNKLKIAFLEYFETPKNTRTEKEKLKELIEICFELIFHIYHKE